MAVENPAPAETAVATALAERVGALSTSLVAVADEVKALRAASGTDLDIKKVVAEFEQMRSVVEDLQTAIRTSKRGLWFPGVEDTSKKFNFAKLCAGVAQRNAEKIAPFECEVLKTTRQQMEKNGILRAGHVMYDDAAGGLWVPDQVLADVIQPIYTQSALIALDAASGRTLISVLDGLTGNPVTLPEFEGGMIAYWIGEEDDYAESKTKSGNITMTPKKLGCMTRMTEELMQFSNPQLDGFIRRDMANAMSKKLDWTAMYGAKSAANMPTGVFNNDKIKTFYAENSTETAPGSYTAGGTEMTFDKLMEMQGVIEDRNVVADDSFAILGANRWFRRLKKTKIDNYSGQTTNQAYLLGAPFISDALLKSIIGNYTKSTQVNTKKLINGSSFGTDVLMGNMREIVMGRWGGIQIVNDGGVGTGFVRDQTFLKMRMWADFQVRQGLALEKCGDARGRDA